MVMRVVVAITLLTAACFEDRYRCTDDAQCDVGAGGRCELDGLCTSRDLTCSTLRGYEDHAGTLSNACYDDRVAPLNACVGGQPPARPDGCFADVCARVPACCEIAWTDACVQLAQQVCSDLVCDTRIAVTGIRNTTTELWDLRWDGAQWSVTREMRLVAPYAWVGPAPGRVEPRLAGTTATTLEIGDTILEIEPGRIYGSITSIGLDRDNRDTIVTAYEAGNTTAFEVWKLDDFSVRDYRLTGSVGTASLSWGDTNRDGFPDGASRTTTSVYGFLENIEGEDFVRKVSNVVATNTQGSGTPGAPNVRTLEWLDLNGDRALDLVAFGASVRIHTNPDGLRDSAERDMDCLPPSTSKPCSDDPEPNLESTSFGGAALPAVEGAALIISAWPGRKLFRATPGAGNAITAMPMTFPGDSCSCQASCTMCPGDDCSCTYDCTSCVTISALVARDLDGDHRLDLVAIDARLVVYTALAAEDYAWRTAVSIPTTFANTFFNVVTSVGGVPR